MARKNNTQTYLEEEYKKRNPDRHWFDEKTIKFFKSKIHPELLEEGLDLYFIESQQPPYGKRQYLVRHMNKCGEVTTNFNGYEQYSACKDYLKEFKS